VKRSFLEGLSEMFGVMKRYLMFRVFDVEYIDVGIRFFQTQSSLLLHPVFSSIIKINWEIK
jgi:hypothetical protein